MHQIGFWNEVVVFGETSFQFGDVSIHQVFSSELLASWEVRGSLEGIRVLPTK